MSGLGRRVAGWAADLPPGAFSLVMATGIVSIAAGLLGLRAPAVALVAVDKLGSDELVAAAALVPGLLIGLRCSRWLSRHLDGDRVRPAVLLLSGIAAVSVVAQTLL